MKIDKIFRNQISLTNDKVFIIDKNDNYAQNFGKQWKDYQYVQIDSYNNNDISYRFLKRITFNNIDKFNGKNVLEIGCGAGRFTEHIVKKAKLCVSVDLSTAIFYNVSYNSNNLILVKADFLNLIPNFKFDIVICRGVIQHTPDPFKTLKKLHEFVDNNGSVLFDIYKMPKIGYLHPKYLLWRPLIKNLFTYEKIQIFLENNIKDILYIKKIIKKILFGSRFLSDTIIPIWEYQDRLELNQKQQEKWAILDTLDGLFAKYDKPQSYKKITQFLKKNNFKIINSDKKNNIFETKKL